MERDSILEKITHASLHFLEPLDPEETYSEVIKEACKLIKGDIGYIALESNGKLCLAYSSVEALRRIRVRKDGYTHTSYSKRHAFVVHASEFVKSHPELVHIGIYSAILIPLFYKNKNMGALAIFSTRKGMEFTEKELSVLKLFGLMATLAIRKAQLYDETRKALESRDVFLSMAAHEFRTPVTSISGYAQLLQTRLPKDGSPVSRWVEALSAETIRLSLLLNELLGINQIKSGEFTYNWKPCSLSDVLGRAVENFRFAYPERKISLENSLQGVNDIVIADFDKLLQVFNNILENAAKFSKKTAPVEITLTGDRSYLVARIQDQGVGINRRDLKNMFLPFYRGETDKEGMGIGLYICKEIVEEHRGVIKIKSKTNKGTTVEVRLQKPDIREI